MDSFLQKRSETTTAHFGHGRSEFLANCSVSLFAGWIQLRLCLPSVCLLGWNSMSIVPIHWQMLPSLWCAFQTGKIVMLMVTPMFVCLCDQQEPSLCAHLCASLPICIAPKRLYLLRCGEVLQEEGRNRFLSFNIHTKMK